MEALGLNATRSSAACSSIEDLQGQLHQLLAAKTTDTRAEHVSPSFEFLSHAVFHLPHDTGNGTTDNVDPNPANPTDPSLPQPSPVVRTVATSETVQNQPTDDPVLQKAVAKYISDAVGAVDQSSWTVRQITRAAQGWQFTYICKDSLQAWTRVNAKNPDRPVIGAHSGCGGLDPINLSRPAFDCRGILTISFSKSNRSIVVSYEHTPLHKTVAQLVALFMPAPVPASNGNNSSQRTPKAKRPRPADGEEGSRKKKTPKARTSLVDGQDDSRKKRTPKAKRPPRNEEEDGEGSRRKRRKTGTAPVAHMGESENRQNTPQSEARSNSGVDKTGLTGFLNVPPAEAERRRDTAIGLLTGRGIDPVTLSSEQFNIFANQAPNLQSASLDMLAKYGAERLRIVHPDEKEQAGSSNTTPAAERTVNASPDITPSQPPEDHGTPSHKPRGKARKLDEPVTEVHIGNGAVVALEQDGEIGTTESALKPRAARFRKTRGRCDTCKQRKVNCTKEHPSCSVCIDAGVECIYLPPKSRRKSEKSAETVERDDSDHLEEMQDETQDHTVHHALENAEQGSIPDPPIPRTVIPPQPPDIENEEFIPDPNILAGPVEHQATTAQPVDTGNYYQHPHTGIGFPLQISADQAATGTSSIHGFPYPQAQTNEEASQPAPSTVFPPLSMMHSQPSPSLPASQPVPAPRPQQRRESTSSSNRKSLPTGQSKQTPVPPPTIPTHTSNWGPSQPAHRSMSVSPTTTHQQPAKRSKPRKPRAEPEKQGQDNLKQATTQLTQYQSPMTRSPYQSAAHVDPRQSHSSQSNTPVATNLRPPPQAPSTTTHPPTNGPSYNAPATSSSASHYDSYPRYNNSNNKNNVNEQYTTAENGHGSSRATYESSSYQANTTTAPLSYSSVTSYDFGRASGASNPLSQALNSTATYSGTTSPVASHWSTSQTRSAQSNNRSTAYSLPAGGTSSSHAYTARAPDSRSSNQNTSYSQTQSQNYNSYPPQQPNLDQQGQQNWYRFPPGHSGNQTGYANDRQSSHGNHRSNAQAYPSQYGGNDEQAIYDLLRTGQSNH